MKMLSRHVRFGLRVLAKSPGFTLAVVLTPGLGIWIDAVIFSLII